MKHVLIVLITYYQRFLSPDHGLFSYRHPYGYCKYYPTCSEYTKMSIQKHGVIKGFVAGAFRILRCNPLSKGGYDPV